MYARGFQILISLSFQITVTGSLFFNVNSCKGYADTTLDKTQKNTAINLKTKTLARHTKKVLHKYQKKTRARHQNDNTKTLNKLGFLSLRNNVQSWLLHVFLKACVHFSALKKKTTSQIDCGSRFL